MDNLYNASEYRSKAHKWRQMEPFNGNIKVFPALFERNVEYDIKIVLESPECIPQGTHFICFLTEHPQSQPQVETKNNSSDFTVKYKYPIMAFSNKNNIPKGDDILMTLPKVLYKIRSRVQEFEIFICLPGKEFSLFDSPYIFETEDKGTESIQLYTSQNTQRKKLRISIAAEQSKDNFYLPDKHFEGTVELKMPWVKKQYQFNKSDEGIMCLEEDLPISHPASFEVHAKGSFGETEYVAHSDLLESSFYPDGMYAFFGDLHVHSNLSDGYGCPENALEYARNWKRLDFIALNEHIENSLCWKMEWGLEKWVHYKKLIDDSNIPGEFITIGGFEYRSFCNLWCFNDEYQKELDPILFEGPEEENEIHRRIADFSKIENWLIGYHRLETMSDMPQFNTLPAPDLLQLAHGKRPPEIGSSLFLQRGDICGFFGGTDTHYGVPGHVFPGQPRNGQSGLTGIICKDLTRKGIYEALKKRRCYATMGSRHLVHFELNGVMMGGYLDIDSSSPVEIRLKAKGKEKISKIEIVKNGINIKTVTINNSTAEINWNDKENPRKNSYYFARLTLDDGRMIWTSPVWVKTT